jgi:hypothetical protein
MPFQEFPHAWRIIRFFKDLSGQKSAAYKPQGFRARHPSASGPSASPIALLLRTGDDKTLLYQVQTMEIPTPLD